MLGSASHGHSKRNEERINCGDPGTVSPVSLSLSECLSCSQTLSIYLPSARIDLSFPFATKPVPRGALRVEGKKERKTRGFKLPFISFPCPVHREKKKDFFLLEKTHEVKAIFFSPSVYRCRPRGKPLSSTYLKDRHERFRKQKKKKKLSGYDGRKGK